MSQINVTTIRNRTGGPPALDKGVVVTGICSATDFSGITNSPADFPNGITGVAATFTGNVSIAGTLTYDDVTRIDSVGIVTAGGGLYVGRTEGTGTGIGITATPKGHIIAAGVCTASSFVGNVTGNVTGNTSGTAGGLTGTPTIDVGSITGIGITVAGVCTVAQGTNLNGYKVEEGKQDGATGLNGEFDFELENGHIQRYSAATGGNYFPDFRVSSSQSLSSIMDVGDVVSTTLIVASSSHYCTTGIKIDNSTSNIDLDWVGGSAPDAANASGFDVYAFTIMKTAATPAYHIIGNALGVA